MYFLFPIKYFQFYDDRVAFYEVLWVNKPIYISYIDYRNKMIEPSLVKNEK